MPPSFRAQPRPTAAFSLREACLGTLHLRGDENRTPSSPPSPHSPASLAPSTLRPSPSPLLSPFPFAQHHHTTRRFVPELELVPVHVCSPFMQRLGAAVSGPCLLLALLHTHLLPHPLVICSHRSSLVDQTHVRRRIASALHVVLQIKLLPCCPCFLRTTRGTSNQQDQPMQAQVAFATTMLFHTEKDTAPYPPRAFSMFT